MAKAICSEETTNTKIGIRHLQCLLLALGLSVAYATRVNLSIAIVAMTDLHGEKESAGLFPWSEKEKSLLQSSFFWGYILTQIPGGQWCRRYDAKDLFLLGNVINSTLAVLTPCVVTLGDWRILMVVRIVQGLAQGVMFPCTHSVLSRWSPPGERATLRSFAYAGTLLGAVIMFGTSGWIISYLYGWPSVFYISGILGLIWCFIWHVWGSSCPQCYKGISVQEKVLLKSLEKPENSSKTPWLKMATSLPCWALLVAHCAHNWGFWTLLTQLPSYMKFILHMDIRRNGLFCALPYLIMLLLTLIFGYLAHVIQRRQWLSPNFMRKCFNTCGQWLPMIFLVALGFCDSSHLVWAVVFIVLSVGLNSSSFLGFQVNHMDLSPNYAGVLMDITNCAANLMSILAPLSVGIVVSDVTNPLQWRLVFFISAGFYFIGNLGFLIFGKTSVLKWNDPPPKPQGLQFIGCKGPLDCGC